MLKNEPHIDILLRYPSFKSESTLGDRSFTYAAPKMWNALSLELRLAKSVDAFEAKLKRQFFCLVFCSVCNRFLACGFL